MHIEFAKEMIEQIKKDSLFQKEKLGLSEYSEEGIQRIFLENLFAEKEFLDCILKIGNDLSKDIAKTIKSKMGSKYFSVTYKQKCCVINDLLANHKFEDIFDAIDFFGK